MKHLPHKTVERLSQYRRALLDCLGQGKINIFSHEVANLLHITPVQVRRDIMLIGYTGNLRKGYDIKELIDLIGHIIDTETGQRVAVVGIGNLGKAIISYFKGRRSKLSIIAGFDVNPEKTGKVYDGVPIYPNEAMQEIIQKEQITIGIITVPAAQAAAVAETLINSGIKGILNYSPKSLSVSPHAYLEEYDMLTSLEKVAYFTKY
ncbi:MAG: redox-sensing transcriptional repressor Rex [Bacteroidetes bacterium]|nr:redox-sensing transcriptional repressor Rex [Bacteroidota bacterium]